MKTKTIKFREPRNIGNEKIDAERGKKNREVKYFDHIKYSEHAYNNYVLGKKKKKRQNVYNG